MTLEEKLSALPPTEGLPGKTLKACEPGEMVDVELRDGDTVKVQSLLKCREGEGCRVNLMQFPDGATRAGLCANEGF